MSPSFSVLVTSVSFTFRGLFSYSRNTFCLFQSLLSSISSMSKLRISLAMQTFVSMYARERPRHDLWPRLNGS